MTVARSLLRDCRAASAAEFAMVLPLLLLLLFGIIDAGRFLWEVNRAEKATQAGVRMAAVTNLVPSGLSTYSFSNGSEAITPGTPVPSSSWGGVRCTQSGCTNLGAGPTPGFNSTAFTAISQRMSQVYPRIAGSNVTITYTNVGIGFAGDPYGSDVAPQITITLNGLTFTPITMLLFANLTMPPTRSSMTLEDGVGIESN